MKQQIGHDSPPTHYAGAREAIDIIRETLGNDGFVAYCSGNAMKYRLRAGKKTEGDPEKADWYEAMARHVVEGTPDPRAYRAPPPPPEP